MSSTMEQFESMTAEQGRETVDALAAMLAALSADDADPVDRATRAGLEGFVMGYRANHT